MAIGLLAAVGLLDHEVDRRGTPRHDPRGHQTALRVTGFGVLDLEHFGAPVDEHGAARRDEHPRRDFDDADAFEGPARATTRRCSRLSTERRPCEYFSPVPGLTTRSRARRRATLRAPPAVPCGPGARPGNGGCRRRTRCGPWCRGGSRPRRPCRPTAPRRCWPSRCITDTVRALRDRAAAEFGVLGGDADHALHRRLQAQHLFDRVRDQRRVVDELLAVLGVLRRGS